MDETARIIAGLGWPTDVSQERMVASVFDRAMRGGMPVAAEMILGYVFDKTEFPAPTTREDKLAVSLHAIRRFAETHGMIDNLAFDGRLVSDEELESESWRSDSPRLPGMCLLYEAARASHYGPQYREFISGMNMTDPNPNRTGHSSA